MVFTVAEDVNQPDQASVLKGKQRRHCGSARKNKGALTTVASSKSKDSKTGTKHNHTEPTENEMGNTSAHVTKNGPASNFAEQPTFHMPETTDCDKKPIADQPAATLVHEDLNNDDELLTTTFVAEHQGNLLGGQELCSNAAQDGEQSEIAKLKQFLMLQVSLISRQQDLLRLRDREIMQLKAANANYKCQLSRVRRRMSKRKSDTDDSPKSSKRRMSENPTDVTASGTIGMLDTATPSVQTSGAFEQFKSNYEGLKSKKLSSQGCNLAESPSDLSTADLSKSDTPGPSGASSTPRSDSVPVPVAFIEQKQAELIQAMMASPPDKAVKAFYDITSSSPYLDEFPFKICDRCPHCVVIAQEIIRLFKTVDTPRYEGLNEPDVEVETPIDREIFSLAGIVFSPADAKECDDEGDEENKVQIMRTSCMYHRIPPTFDQNHWWWDLKCDGIKSENALKIPTWHEQEMTPLMPGSDDDDVTEVTDDLTFMKRHSKLEQDEKRRKRWDIQRIREYRYNEKLRQKLLKQGAVYDAPVIESFSGHLHDAESVEVHESLPVNVFGYPTPNLQPEEFDLASLRELTKGGPSVSSKKRARRV